MISAEMRSMTVAPQCIQGGAAPVRACVETQIFHPSLTGWADFAATINAGSAFPKTMPTRSITVAPKPASASFEKERQGFRRDTLENSPGLTPAAPMRLRRPESGSRGREAGASRILILSPGGAPPMQNSDGARWCEPRNCRNRHSGLDKPQPSGSGGVTKVFTQTRQGGAVTLR